MTLEQLSEYIETTEARLYADLQHIQQLLVANKDTIGHRKWVEVQWFTGRLHEHHDGLERALNNIKNVLEESENTGTKI